MTRDKPTSPRFASAISPSSWLRGRRRLSIAGIGCGRSARHRTRPASPATATRLHRQTNPSNRRGDRSGYGGEPADRQAALAALPFQIRTAATGSLAWCRLCHKVPTSATSSAIPSARPAGTPRLPRRYASTPPTTAPRRRRRRRPLCRNRRKMPNSPVPASDSATGGPLRSRRVGLTSMVVHSHQNAGQRRPRIGHLARHALGAGDHGVTDSECSPASRRGPPRDCGGSGPGGRRSLDVDPGKGGVP